MARKLQLSLLAVLLITVCAIPGISSQGTKTADVIVIGGGGAGLMAAIGAADLGASVIVLEKTSALGGALLYTAGTMSGAETKIQKAQGIEDSVDSHFMDSLKEGEYKAIPELLKLYVDLAGPTVDWLKDSLGVDIKEAVFAPEHTLYSRPRSYKPAPINGVNATLVALREAIAKRPSIEVMLNTKAIRLEKNQLTDAITGVIAVGPDGKVINLNARRGVIIATGGFGANKELLARYLPGSENWIMIVAAGATGDGIIMGQEAGAALTHMQYVPTYNMGFIMPNGRPSLLYTRAEVFGGIYVNKNAQRFVDEMSANSHREEMLRRQPESIMVEIFDEPIRAANNKANVDALIKSGAIPQANTLAELAAKVGLPAQALEATVARYNSHVANKKDPDFGRTDLKAQIATPPFYGVVLRPLGLLTLGGLHVNTSLQVLDRNGRPIPNLYAAGEVVGGVHGSHISSGNGVTVALAFGRRAGEIAAASGAPAPAKQEKVAAYKDGVYRGKGTGFHGDIVVEVTVAGGAIAKVTIVSHDDTPFIFSEAEAVLPKRIVEAKSTKVDVVSGATYSSEGIIEAVNKALEGAK